MRKDVPEKLEAGRVRNGEMASDSSYGFAGYFVLMGPTGAELRIMSGGKDGTGWEHVSVSLDRRTPNWREMCWVKDLFWNEDECVVQYHPPASKHINLHPNCLHLWRPVSGLFPMPPVIMV